MFKYLVLFTTTVYFTFQPQHKKKKDNQGGPVPLVYNEMKK